VLRVAHDAVALLDRLQREAAAHPAQADYAELAYAFAHADLLGTGTLNRDYGRRTAGVRDGAN
jgi:hypothetical protein